MSGQRTIQIPDTPAGVAVPYVTIGTTVYRPTPVVNEIDQLAADVLAYACEKGHLPPAGSGRPQMWKAVEEAGEFVQAAAKVQLAAARDWRGVPGLEEEAAVEEACDMILATLAWLALRSGTTPQKMLRARLDAVIERGR